MKIGSSLLLIATLALFVCLGAAGAAEACCIYNHTDGPVEVYLGCGIGCHNDWWLDPGEKKCRHGKGGKVDWGIYKKGNTITCNANKGKIKVDKHGWVSFYQRKGYYLVKSWEEDGGLKKKIKLYMFDD